MFKKILISALILLMFLSVKGIAAQAEGLTVIHKQLSEVAATVELDETISVKYTNQTDSKIEIINGSKVLFSDKAALGKYEDVYLVSNKDIQHVIVTKRLEGTGGTLSFKVLQINGPNIKLTYQSVDYSKARINLKEGKIQVQYPVYKAGDSNTKPSNELIDEISINTGEKTTLTPNSTDQAKANSFSISSTGGEETPQERIKRIASTVTGKNPANQELSKKLTEKALENGIPPEILKAIAWQESTWRQFYSDGTPVIGFDGLGIGLMQITDTTLSDEEIKRLMTDIDYNLQKGINILLEKWNYGNKRIPTINNNDQELIENWYFAIMAYNGISMKNDPLQSSTTYQDKIYNHIKNYGLLETTPFPKEVLDGNIYYNEAGSLYFKELSIKIPGPFTTTAHNINNSQIVRVTGDSVNVRTSPTGTVAFKARKGELLQIAGAYRYDGSNTNHFVWYPVKKQNSSTVYYISSAYLEKFYTDVKQDGWYVDGIRYLSQLSISNGYPDGTFKPNSNVSRAEAVKMIGVALSLDGTLKKTIFPDVKPEMYASGYIDATYKLDIVNGYPDGTFKPEKSITRGEMAFIMKKAFNYPDSYKKAFSDVPSNKFYYSAVNALKEAAVLEGYEDGTFRPDQPITRAEFATLLANQLN
ncbi:transglycosylase-like protein with SLT domain [Cytobacillus firmus]|uniref:Transglycosylase-like protein with SLT domain n=2 Tax=Cytobacillus TaxID=2675230 RepID=A0A366JVQ2_CYTFI|nr:MULTISPECIES: S-layer homology domain-containing protein [Cytobacillus]RBP91542.1 transglycosylase-like protein with SLT domain [Cytobacillus firmus]TDX41742.1 transglycosylase-like protein with SLT domain [Cytobacillus oceanisediminis]